MNHISYKELSNKDYKVFLAQKIKYTKQQLKANAFSPIQKERALAKITKMYNELSKLK